MAVAEGEASAQSPEVTPATVPRSPVAGLLTGVVGCLCALGSLLSIGLFLLPLATLFSLVALARSLWLFSFAGGIVAVLSSLLTIFAIVTSPVSAGEISKLIGAGTRTEAALFEGRSVPVVTAAQPMPQPSGSAQGVTKPVTPPATPPAAPAGAADHTDNPSADSPQMNKVSSSPTPEAVAPSARTVSPMPVAPLVTKPPVAPLAAKPLSSAASPTQTNSGTAKTNAPGWPDDSVAQVRAIQLLLEDLGLYQGTTRGTLGPSTRAAIRTFQRANGEPETGEPSEALFRALQKKAASR